jgi:hypothetical protein
MRDLICKVLLIFTLVASQPLAAQSNVAFEPEVYQARRANLIRALGDGAAIVPSRYLIGEMSWGNIRMDPDFWYLTGLETVYSILVVTPERTAVFVPDEHQFLGGQYPMADFEDFRNAQWNRPGAWRITPGPEGREISGIEEIYPLAEFDERLDDILGDVGTVHLPIDPAELYTPPGLARPFRGLAAVAAAGEYPSNLGFCCFSGTR